jgi:hypothetical protein
MSHTFLHLCTITYEFSQLRKNICLVYKVAEQMITRVLGFMKLLGLFLRNFVTDLH